MVFQKTKRVPFSNKEIFGSGFKPTMLFCYNIVAKMLFDQIINISGGIDLDRAGSLTRADCWSYIYYLYTYNNSNLPVFIMMKDEKGKASGELFYNAVKSSINNDDNYNIRNPTRVVTTIDINSLIYFINKIINDNWANISNPIIETLQKLVKKETTPQITNFTIKTRDNNVKLNSKNVEFISGKDANNANIKVRFNVAS